MTGEPDTATDTFRWWPLGIGFLLGLGSFVAVKPPWVNPTDILCAALALWLVFIEREDRRAVFIALLLVLAAAPGILWTANNTATGGALLRFWALPVVAFAARKRWHAPSFCLGVGLALAINALPLPLFLFTERTGGLTRYPSILGAVSFAGFAVLASTRFQRRWYALPASVGTVLAVISSAARAPVVAMAVFAPVVLSRKGLFLLASVLILAGAVATLCGHPTARFASFKGLVQAAERRWSTVTGTECDAATDMYGPEYVCGRGRLTWHGTGLMAYLDENPWPRPHNVYVLLGYELGVFAVVPFALFALAWWRKWIDWRMLLALAVYGLLDDSLLQPEGYYVVAIALTAHAVARVRVPERVPRSAWWRKT